MGSTYKDSYEERNSGEDMADLAMQQHLKNNNCIEYVDYLRIGTDPKENKLDMFWYATKILLVPDYILVRKGFIFFIEVKGTIWIDHNKLYDYWIDPRIPMKYYPELDFQGNKKAYKEIPL